MPLHEIGRNIIRIPEVPSTNNYTTELVRQSVILPGTVVIADHQTNGKGQRGNRWEDVPGTNLLMSVWVQPDWINIGDQFALNEWVSLSLKRVLESIIGDEVNVKWPNDLLVGSAKISGILIETTSRGEKLQAATLGVGLNINQQSFDPMHNATSLALILGKTINRDEVANAVIKELDTSFQSLCVLPALHRTYTKAVGLINQPKHAIINGVKQSIEVLEIAQSGALKVKLTDNSVKVFGFHELKLMR